MRVRDEVGGGEEGGEQHPTTPFKIDQSHHSAFAAVISSKYFNYCYWYQLTRTSATGPERDVLKAGCYNIDPVHCPLVLHAPTISWLHAVRMMSVCWCRM